MLWGSESSPGRSFSEPKHTEAFTWRPRQPACGLHTPGLEHGPTDAETPLPPGQLIRRLFGESTDDTAIQLVRYTLVGGLAYVLDFSILALLTELGGVYYLTSSAVGFLCGLALNYVLSVAWVFRTRRVRSRTIEFAIFAGIGLVGLGLNQASLWLLTEVIGIHYLMSKILATALVYLWNFSIRKLILFRSG